MEELKLCLDLHMSVPHHQYQVLQLLHLGLVPGHHLLELQTRLVAAMLFPVQDLGQLQLLVRDRHDFGAQLAQLFNQVSVFLLELLDFVRAGPQAFQEFGVVRVRLYHLHRERVSVDKDLFELAVLVLGLCLEPLDKFLLALELSFRLGYFALGVLELVSGDLVLLSEGVEDMVCVGRLLLEDGQALFTHGRGPLRALQARAQGGKFRLEGLASFLER